MAGLAGFQANSPIPVGLDDIPVSQPPPRPSSSTTISEATHTMGSNGDLSGKLVFMTGSGGELYVINVDGSGLRRLTGGIIDPVLSPNGQQVAFTRWDGGRTRDALYHQP